MMMRLVACLVVFPTLCNAQEAPTYGVDVSFPIHHRVSTNYDYLPHNVNASVQTPVEYRDMALQPLGDRQAAYVAHVDACRKHYGEKANLCDVYEYDRILMNARQPCSMQACYVYMTYCACCSDFLSLVVSYHDYLFSSTLTELYRRGLSKDAGARYDCRTSHELLGKESIQSAPRTLAGRQFLYQFLGIPHVHGFRR